VVTTAPPGGVVDAHVHLLPGRLAEAVRAFFDDRLGPEHAGLRYPLDHVTVLAMLAAEGVGEVWSLPYAHKPGVAAGLNEASAATAERARAGPVRVVGGATVHPADEDPAGIVRDGVDRLGLRVLKLHCSVGGFAIDDVRLAPVLDLAAERRLPVVVHLGHAVDGRTEVHELDALRRAADAHPAARLVLAHCGHHAAPAAIRLLDAHPALHADLTPVGTGRPELRAPDLAGRADRVLFGSDAPNTPLTAGAGIEWVRALGLAPADERSVLGGTARRLVAEVLVG